MTTLLSIKNLSLSFGNKRVLDKASLEISEGEMVAIVGESGSGKSLTALSCLGLQPTNAQLSGEITLDGITVLGDAVKSTESHLKHLRGNIASVIFQEPMTALNPLHTIGKQIAEILKIHQPQLKDRATRVKELLEEVGLHQLTTRLGAYPHELSGGQRQRVMIAMAIANTPKLLIADEPTTAVDVTVQKKILELLKQLQLERKMAMMFITHDLTLVKRLADKVVVMKEGKVVEQGKVKEVFAAPSHPYTKELLSSAPTGSMPTLAPDLPSTMACEQLKIYFPIKTGLLRRTTGYVKAVDDISVSIPKGATLGVVGESGSGKTTLGFALLRLIKSEGKIVYMGRDIAPLSASAMQPLRSDLQLVFQDPYSSLNPRMTVGQIIKEGLAIHAKKVPNHDQMVATILSEVGLQPDMAARYPHEFSGGQRQRIAIARAMVLKPNFVVLDEPTSALDLTVQTQILELLKRFQQRHNISFMFISHDLRVVRAISHQIAVLHAGKIVEYGDTSRILQQPNHDYTKRLIDAAML